MSIQIDRRSSEIINALRFPLTILVVCSHCVLTRNFKPIEFSLDGDNLFLAVDMITRSLGAIVVAWFALISGYFFFSRDQFVATDYTKALRSRGKSLLIPYILWNLIYIAVLWGKNYFSTLVGFAPGIQPQEQYILSNSSLLQMMLLPLNHPLWYVRELIYLTIASPIIYILIRYLRLGAVVLMAIPLLGLLPWGQAVISRSIGVSIWFYFVLGAYLRSASIDPVRLAHRLRWVGILGTIAHYVLLLFLSDRSYFHWSFQLSMLTIPILAFNVCAYLYDRGAKVVRYWTELSRTAFFVYSIHAIVVINLIRGFLYTTPLANNGYGHIAILLITAGSVSILSVLAYYIAVRIAPRITAILCGGRI